jgi:hypothetical protein
MKIIFFIISFSWGFMLSAQEAPESNIIYTSLRGEKQSVKTNDNPSIITTDKNNIDFSNTNNAKTEYLKSEPLLLPSAIKTTVSGETVPDDNSTIYKIHYMNSDRISEPNKSSSTISTPDPNN